MEEKEFTILLVKKLNEIQKTYNPTNPEFILTEDHNTEEKSIEVHIKNYNFIENKILFRQKFKYVIFNDTIIPMVYSHLNENILKALLFSDYVSEVIKNISTLNNGKL